MMTEAQAAIWREAIRLNKEGAQRERITAFADLCEMKGNKALDEALDNAGRIHDPTECFYHVGGWFAAAAALRTRAARETIISFCEEAVVIHRLQMAGDQYLIDYLLGWGGFAEPKPWGAATSFALEVAHDYGLVRGESDGTLTALGEKVAGALAQARGK